MTRAQYRMLGRIVRGEILPCSNYRGQHATIGALMHKGFIGMDRLAHHWVASDRGLDVFHRSIDEAEAKHRASTRAFFQAEAAKYRGAP